MSREVPAAVGAVEYGLFHGVRAYFVEAGVQARRLKIWGDKVQQFGGRLEDHLSHEITHVFALDVEKLQERVTVRKLKRHLMKALRYEWIQDCLKEGLLLPVEPYVLTIQPKQQTSAVLRDAHGQPDVVDNDTYSTRKKGKEKAATDISVADQKTSSGGTLVTNTSTDFGSDVEVFSSAFHESSRENGSPSLRYIPPNLNQNITEPFAELRDIYKNALGDDRRSFSYHKTISVLEKVPFKVENVDQVKGLPTIGKSMQEHIYDILTTGKLPKLENLKNDERVCTLSLFSSIWGIGPATAQRFYEKGYRSLDDLRDEPSLTASQRVGLRFYHDLNVKIPRHEVKEMEILVRAVAEEIQPGMMVLCGGSYRRGKSFCGDIDFVITHPDGSSHKGFLVKLVAALKKMDFLAEDLLVSTTNSIEGTDSGVDTYYGLCKYPGREQRHRIDLKVYSREMYPFGLIAWTGNDVLNRRLRLLAEAKGFTLDDTGLFPRMDDSHGQKAKKKRTTVPCKTEREVFDLVGFPWLEPHERNL